MLLSCRPSISQWSFETIHKAPVLSYWRQWKDFSRDNKPLFSCLIEISNKTGIKPLNRKTSAHPSENYRQIIFMRTFQLGHTVSSVSPHDFQLISQPPLSPAISTPFLRYFLPCLRSLYFCWQSHKAETPKTKEPQVSHPRSHIWTRGRTFVAGGVITVRWSLQGKVTSYCRSLLKQRKEPYLWQVYLNLCPHQQAALGVTFCAYLLFIWRSREVIVKSIIEFLINDKNPNNNHGHYDFFPLRRRYYSQQSTPPVELSAQLLFSIFYCMRLIIFLCRGVLI